MMRRRLGAAQALAFELANLNEIAVTVVDPRPMDLKRLLYKWKRGMYFRTEPLQHYNTPAAAEAPPEVLNAGAVHAEWRQAARAAAEQRGGEHRRPEHWRVCWEPALWEAEGEALEATLARLQAEAAAMQWTRQGLVQGSEQAGEEEEEGAAEEAEEAEEGRQPLHDAGADEEARPLAEEGRDPPTGAAPTGAVPPLRAEEVRRALAASSAVVGMHPDGATEAIVDFGLSTGKIFACVPCCVYSTLFPTRRDARGRLVKRYDAFIEYLLAKAPGRIGVATLPFEGKNKVIYSLRPDQQAMACAPCDPDG